MFLGHSYTNLFNLAIYPIQTIVLAKNSGGVQHYLTAGCCDCGA